MKEPGEPKIEEIKKKVEEIEGVEVGKVPERRPEMVIEEEKEKRIRKEEELERIREEVKMTMKEEEVKEELKKEKIFEILKKFVGIPKEELKEYDDLILNDTEDAWKFREEEAKYRKEVIATVAGIKSERAKEFLLEKLGRGEKQKNWRVICLGLIGNNTSWADEIREWLRFDKEKNKARVGISGKVVEFLGLNKSEGFYNFRRALDKISPQGFYLPGDLLLSTTGLSVKEKREIKWWEEVAKLYPAEAILSFLGDSSPEAQKKVKEYYGEDKKLKWAYQRYLESVYEKS